MKTPHSVQTWPKFFGTTQTLAHTGKDVTESSYSFTKEKGLTEIPESRYKNTDLLIKGMDRQITRLKLLHLSNELNHYLREQPNCDLSSGEAKHLVDYHEFNYLETSLLPALAILQIQIENREASWEFSQSAELFLLTKLREIDSDLLKEMIAENQQDLSEQRLSVDVTDPVLQEALFERSVTERRKIICEMRQTRRELRPFQAIQNIEMGMNNRLSELNSVHWTLIKLMPRF
jgi:hypothetical protein